MPCIPHKKRIFAITSKKTGCAPTQTLPGEYFPNWHSKVKKVKVKFVRCYFLCKFAHPYRNQ